MPQYLIHRNLVETNWFMINKSFKNIWVFYPSAKSYYCHCEEITSYIVGSLHCSEEKKTNPLRECTFVYISAVKVTVPTSGCKCHVL